MLKLEGVQYNWKNNGVHEYGVIAQQVEEVLPDVVVTDKKTGYKAVKYQNLISPIIESIKQLYQKLVGQEAEVTELKSKVESLEKQNRELNERLQRLEDKISNLKD